ncbi:hypothetical protein FVEG_01897 [Fusarium verticillioides 7600]|uniref:Uncharacterized protein n=2 Tax=Fusarium fujikuroi species complex TaxID=171627 RepID=W7LJW3_GIBM7|nr:hypothetical protein FVEG_01897 [Fusarium verticillioides 7600]EWG38766.1 hypothetical protein FVEG_01897 [Fusarium verticillioides 7600]
MFLLEFMTFDGLRAYQPCCENIDHLNILKSLRTIEPDGDPVFEAAREWSCIIQARQDLPKDIR